MLWSWMNSSIVTLSQWSKAGSSDVTLRYCGPLHVLRLAAFIIKNPLGKPSYRERAWDHVLHRVTLFLIFICRTMLVLVQWFFKKIARLKEANQTNHVHWTQSDHVVGLLILLPFRRGGLGRHCLAICYYKHGKKGSKKFCFASAPFSLFFMRP